MPATFQDYYATLGVDKSAPEKEIKAAFRKLARKYHPDMNSGDKTAEAKFKEISEAYEVLGDPEKRQKYDEVGEHWKEYEQWERAGRPGGGNPFAGSGPQVEYRTVSPEELESMFGEQSPFSSFFYDIFGAGEGGPGAQQFGGVFGRGTQRTRQRSIRGSDVEGEAEITLEEAYRGTSRVLEMNTATGNRRVEIKIPAGIKDGTKVRAAGQGGQGHGAGTAGDLYVTVRVRPHPHFVREGDNLRLRLPVPLHIALLGGEVSVPTLRGRPVSLTIPPDTQNGKQFRLRGLGMPKLSTKNFGDLVTEIDVRLPVPLSNEARAAVEVLRPRD